jgi:L-ascorbate metabolism protein UlaG (beta-lactamase superfamily)
MQTGRGLTNDVSACSPENGQLALWWLGQHSFILKLGAKTIYLDPFISDHANRLVAPLMKAADIASADFITGSHDHTDHIDRGAWPSIATASPKARFIVPVLIRDGLVRDLKIPVERFIGMDDGQTVEVDGLRITAVASAHELLDRDPATGHYPYLGFVIEGNGCVIYHSGDTCNYEGLQTKLSRWKFDVLFLPINGRDARRLASGCIGNMTYQEAADLAGALAPKVTIPGHYGMFNKNTVDPQLFVDYMKVKYPSLKVLCGELGTRQVLPR